jgi:hypothetical protein
MGKKAPSWEDELWSCLSKGDGIRCPVYAECRLRLSGSFCLSDNEEYYKTHIELLDNDDPDFTSGIEFNFLGCPESGRIFRLVTKLAVSYQMKAGISSLPVPENIITKAYDNLPVEVRRVALKSYHGAVWRFSDCWLVHLNSNDTPARQRFTLYHEIFHILAHCKATPVFKKSSGGREGTFNELLADHFSAVMLLPREWVAKMWPEVKDISQMAAIFEVPKPIMYLGLRGMGLI